MSKLLLICAVAMLCGCTVNDEKVVRIVEAQGMTDVKTTGYKVFACDEKDTFSTGFIAKDAKGRKVSGVVCSGLLKGATVRYD